MFHVVLNQYAFLSVDHKSRNFKEYAGQYFQATEEFKLQKEQTSNIKV